MTDPPRTRDPRPAADGRDDAANDRDDCANRRDARAAARDDAARLRDDSAHTRDTDEDQHCHHVLDQLRVLRERLAEAGTTRAGAAGVTPGEPVGDAPSQHTAPAPPILTSDEAAAATSLLDDTVALLERSSILRVHTAGDRDDGARDRVAAAGDRVASSHDRDSSAADRQQASIDRVQADHRSDFSTRSRRLAPREVNLLVAERLERARLASQTYIAESRRILDHIDRPNRGPRPPAEH